VSTMSGEMLGEADGELVGSCDVGSAVEGKHDGGNDSKAGTLLGDSRG
jgi:hypothetical protein